ncbi:MAG: gamma-glutamyltransferase [Sneathiella sp.]|nr:gamma-glutamyltransferase [Sneathiella sp.]
MTSITFVSLSILITTANAKTLQKFMISAANPLAAKAGFDILQKGASAVDAAIATQMVLTLVEPQSSGIGGGAFLLHFNNATNEVSSFDGREMAPAAVKENHFIQTDGNPQKFYDAVVGGQSVGVPGVLAMMNLAHKTHGKLPWKDLFVAAIDLSENGFPISPRLHFLLNRDKYLKTKVKAAAYFYDAEGNAKPVGHILKNPELAATLKAIASNGVQVFYTGAIAREIVKAVQDDPNNPGLLSETDMANYLPKIREPVCQMYRKHKVCGMGPPTSGGITSLQILKLLENYDLPSMPAGSIDAINLISEASALAFADRGKFLGDADFVEIPVTHLLDSDYIKQRSKLIIAGSTNVPYSAGNPTSRAGFLSIDDAIELPSTSHFSIIDKEGNAVSITTSVENVFGSRLMAGGFILNNQLTDFSFRPVGENGPVNNRIQPGKRPRSSMSPTLVLDEKGDLFAVIGSPGGSRIIGYVTSTLIGILDWGMNMQQAIDMPHHINRNGTLDLEKNTPLAAHKKALEAMGYTVKLRSLTSGLHGILLTEDGIQGGADPRREGVVLSN